MELQINNLAKDMCCANMCTGYFLRRESAALFLLNQSHARLITEHVDFDSMHYSVTQFS